MTSIHPYFKLHPGNEAAAEAIMDEFIAATKTETACLFYGFTVLDDQVFCREAYKDAAGVLAHLENVGPILERMLGISELTRLEFHGPAEEIDRLREPLADLNPDFFVLGKSL